LALKTQIKTLRAHKLSALLVDARLYARRTPEEACTLLGWEEDHLEDLETATITPTLPELEAMAAIYAVPVDHFFGNTSLSDGMPRLRTETMRQRLELRNRILGAMIMQARLRRNFSRDDLSMATSLSLEQIIEYELGQVPIPVTDLEDITRMLQIDVADWIDSYAIPTRDMTFRPYRITDIHQTSAGGEKPQPESIAEQAETIKPEEEGFEEKPSELPAEELVLEPVVSQLEEPVNEATVPESIQEPVPTEPQPVLSQPREKPATEPAPEQSVEQQISSKDIDFLLEQNLPPELVNFISNPINKQYLLLANNLSRMPADQLRRIAESLLEITF
jgi:transcriptional regulator with XRE-family HTH domain